MDAVDLNVTLNLTIPTTTLDYNESNYDNETFYIYIWILQKVSITFYSIIFALGIIGNGLVIWIAGFRMKKTISAVWFLNLAIADFLCCASTPLQIYDWVYYLSVFQFCSLNMTVFNLNMSASVFILTAMSIDRGVSVMWPFWAKVHRTRKLVRITVAIIWVLSLIFTGLLFMFNQKYFYGYGAYCSFVPGFLPDSLYEISLILKLIRLVIMFVIPFLIISISYASIFFKLRKNKRPQRSQRPYRIISAVILCFLICWSPYYILPLTPIYDSYYLEDHTLIIIITYLSYLNSCINPIIYVFMGQDFKHSFLRSIPFRLERALSEQHNNLCEELGDCEPTCSMAVQLDAILPFTVNVRTVDI